MAADWFAANAPAVAASPPPGDWFAKNAPPAKSSSPDDPAQRGLFSSFYDTGIKPVWDTIKDVYNRGGIPVTEDMASGVLDQVKNFAAHPDIRNFPVIGPAAQATADRMQKQYDAGNYGGMVGSAGGFIAPFLTPGVIAEAPRAAEAIAALPSKLRAALPDSVPQLSGAAVDAVGLVSPRAAHAVSLANRGVKIVNAALKATAPGEEVAPVVDAAHPLEPAAAHPLAPSDAPLTPAPQTPVAPPAGLPGPAPGIREPGPFGTPEPPAHWEPPARTSGRLRPADWFAENAPPAAPEPIPVSAGLSAAHKLEDAADEQAARMQSQAEDIVWANRAHKADRFAAYLLKNKLEPTPENLAGAAKAMAERAVPADETVPMIHDRMGYQAAVPDLEQQLRDSLAARGISAAELDAAQRQVNPARPIMAMARQQWPAGSWIMPGGKVEQLNRAAGETHVEALTRLKVKGDAYLHPLENGLIRQSGDAVQVGDVSNPNLAAALDQAAQTPEAAQTRSIIVVHGGGDPIHVPLHLRDEFLRNRDRYVRPSPSRIATMRQDPSYR